MEGNVIQTKYYDPSVIFNDNSNPQGMTGQANLNLATSFYHSRYDDDGEFNNRFNGRETRFSRNAGAIQLYYRDQVTVYPIPGFETKEYNTVSTGGSGRDTYGHTERELMRVVLDDLMKTVQADGGNLLSPSDPNNFPNPEAFIELMEEEQQREILIRLTERAEEYKGYLEQKEIIVKMWSERPPCNYWYYAGQGCDEFIGRIFPEGSHFGYTAKDYKIKEDWKVEAASEELKNAYLEYVGRQRQALPLWP